MKATVILKDDSYVEHEDRHASVTDDGEVWILNLEGEITETYYHGAWKSVTTFA